MKHQKQKSNSDNQLTLPFTFFVERIHIKVKFGCRLYLEYSGQGQTKKSKQIRIDQKNTLYKLDQQISWQIINDNSKVIKPDSNIAMYVKLLSNKGLAFTAGIINITYADFTHYSQSFTLKLMKTQDFDAYIDCRRINVQHHNSMKKLEQIDGLDEINKYTPHKINAAGFQNVNVRSEVRLVKTTYEQNQSVQSYSNSNTQSKSVFKKVKIPHFQHQSKDRQKELQEKIDYLQSQLHKNRVFFDKQKQIIMLLQSKQRQSNDQNKQLKKLIRANEGDIEEKRQKIRELQGEKVKLLMNSLQSEKEISSLKQKIGLSIDRSYQYIKNVFKESNNKIFNEFGNKQDEKNKQFFKNSLSKIAKKDSKTKNNDVKSIQIKQGQQISKVAFSAVRGLMNKEVGQAWLEEQSLAYRENNTSSVLSNTLYDMSISNINGKVKQLSLTKNKQLKQPDSELNFRFTTINKQYVDEVAKNMNRLQNMVSKNIQRMVESFLQIIQKYKNGKEDDSAQQSLLTYLQQLQNGFEKQLGVLGQKQKIMAYYQQIIQQLNQNLSEKENMIVQLQQQLFKLQEQRDGIKSQLHQNNYLHAIKEQQYLKKIHVLEYGISMPDSSSSVSPTKTMGRRKQHKVVHNPYQQQLIQYKQHLRLMEIQVLHQREQKSKLMHLLHNKEIQMQQIRIQQRKMQFSMKFKERITSLNQSIELSIDNDKSQQPKNNQKLTLESIGYEKGYDQ